MDTEDAVRRAFEARAERVEFAPDALGKIRARTGRRRLGVGVAALATAAVVAVAVLVVSLGRPPVTPPPPGVGSSGPGPTSTPALRRLPVYVVGTVAGRSVLYREYHPLGPGPGGDVAADIRVALTDMVGGRTLDPDYRGAWPGPARVGAVSTAGDTITVDMGLGSAVPTDWPLAVQQLVHTATAVASSEGESQLVKVRLRVDAPGKVTGVDIGRPLVRDSNVDILAPVWLSSPQEGDVVGPSFDAQLVGTVPGGAAVLRVLDDVGTVVTTRPVALDAAYPHQGEVHVRLDLPPGRYRLEAYYLDGNVVAAVDDHTVTVRSATSPPASGPGS